MKEHIILIMSINIIYILKYIAILDDFVILLDNYDFFNFFEKTIILTYLIN